MFPAQQYAYDVALEVQSEEAGDPDPGCWAYGEVLDAEPRRSGKTFKSGPLVAHRCGSRPGVSAWITAQKREAAVRRWNAIRQQLAGPRSPLSGLRVRVGKNDELIRWPTGSTFQPFSPNDDALHGDEPDLVLVDELWSFDLAAKSAIEQGYKPAWLVKDGQAWLMSAAGTTKSTWLNGRREKGYADVAAGVRLGRATFDWRVPDEVGGVRVDELPNDQLLDVVLDCHPRRDNGLRVGYLREQLDDMGRTDFLRAYGNITAAGVVKYVINADAWRRATSSVRIPATARVGIAFDVDPERREAAVSAAWRDPATGKAYTELLRCAPGTRWVAGYVRDVVRRQNPGAVCVNNAGPARDVADQLEQLGVELLRVTAGDYSAACARFSDEITDAVATVAHRGEREVADAMRAASKRRLANGFAWDRSGEDPITALVSHTLALWAVDHMPAEIERFRIA